MKAEPYSFNYKQMQAQIRHEFNAQGVSDELMKLQAVRESRLIRSVKPEVITFESSGEDNLAPLPGSVLMVAGRKGNAIFEDLRRAFRASDRTQLSSLGKQLITMVQRRKVVSVAQAVRLIKNAPSLFDLRYRSTTLAPNISLVGGVEIGTISFPYNGGHLNDDEFSIVEYHQAETERDYDVFLVKRSPDLSELERSMLEQVAETSDMLNLGSAACCPGMGPVSARLVHSHHSSVEFFCS